MIETTPRQRYLRRWAALKDERATWLDHWRDLSDQINPRRSRFLASDRNKSRRNDKIINSTPRRAKRILESGMMAGVTSPARPWFRLTTPDSSLAEAGPVRDWLHLVEERLRLAFARSNVYSALHSVYGDLVQYGIAALHVDEDDEDLFRAYVHPVGQYALACSARQQVDTVYRELSMTVAQLVERFGLEACSASVRDLYQRGQVDQWREVLHVVEPNRDRKLGQSGPKGMVVRSCWLELAGDDSTGFLREGGYEEMPTLCPRWEATGEDVYGYGPGMDALGDCRALQLLERRKAQLVDKIVTPPMGGPASLSGKRVSLLPGDYTPLDSMAAGQRIEPLMVVPPQALGAVEAMIQTHEQRINATFFADLWLMLTEGEGGRMTAREVAERHEEKMLQLGPVLERLQDELLDPLIDRAFAILLRSGQIPPAPDELQGQDLKVEYISIIAQAQKLLGVTAIERLAGFVGSMAQTAPDALDKVNADEMIDSYADALGVPPNLVRTDEQVAEIRDARAAQQQAQRQGEAMAAAAQGAKNLAGASMEGDTALTRMLGGMGVAPPAGPA